MLISKKEVLFLSIGLLILSIAKLFNFIPNFLGGFLLVFDFILFFLCLDPILKYLKIPPSNFTKILFLLVYYSISLSLIYYIIGLNSFSISVWFMFNFGVIFFFYFSDKIKDIKISLSIIKISKDNMKSPEFWTIFIILFFLIGYFFYYPIIDGNPTPWPKPVLIGFTLFLIATFLLLKRLMAGKNNPILSLLYFFLITGIIAIRYILSYGYDTLIHQGSLKYILEYGQISPLTPFYIGQYVLEILVNMFFGLSFTFLERWIGPALFLSLIFFGGHYFLRRLKLQNNFLLIPISVILLFPNIFSYTSPYALSLLWGIMAILFIFLFLSQRSESDLKLAILCSLASFFIHPFVGLNILVWSVGLYFLRKNKIQNAKGKLLVGVIFVIASLAVILAFILYSWLRDSSLVIYDPLYFY